MKIKYRITILFTVVVTTILILLCVGIFYFSELNRQKEFRKRLRNRALTTISLLLKVPGIDKDLLKKIDESTLIAIQQKSVVVYDSAKKEVYKYADENVIPVTATEEIFEKTKKHGQFDFTYNSKDVVSIEYLDPKGAYIVIASAYDKDGLEKSEQLKYILIFSLITGILVTFISGLFFSIGLVRPIKKIANDVKEISSQNLSRRIKITEPKDELNELSATFNDLLNRLQESFNTQTRFIANASHELSTPLTSVLSQLEITLQNERTVPEYKDVINSVYDDVRNLSQLTKNLLGIAKASGNPGGIELILIRIDEVLLKLPSELKRIDPKYIVELHFDSFPDDEDKMLVFGNADLLYSAIKNIAINACKYSENHIANVSLHFNDTSLDILIKDYGPGIKEADKQYIFQPFYRGNHINSLQGFGLGLSLASKIIGIHKGQLLLDSSYKQGSLFKIVLPIGKSFHAI